MQTQMTRNHSIYSETDHQIWSILIDKHYATRKEKASREYKLCLQKLKILQNNIPDLQVVNHELLNHTGWKLHPVGGLVPEENFFKLLSNKMFPIVEFIRPIESLDYVDVPDLFHDLYAHVPLLSNLNYCKFLSGLSYISSEYDHNEYVISLLSRIYWYAIETGLILEDNKLKIYGAAVLSSHKEAENVYEESVDKFPFNISEIIDTPYNYFLQTKYFVIDSFEELCNSLPEIRKEIEKKVKKRKF